MDDQVVARVASEYNVPPAVLAAFVNHRDGDLVLGLLSGYDLQPDEVQSNDELALTVAAQQLSNAFGRTGSWEDSISLLVSGSPDEWQSPTGSVGGTVYSVLGLAALDPTYGMDQWRPTDPNAFTGGVRALNSTLVDMNESGGIVTRDTVSSFRDSVRNVSQFVAPTSRGLGVSGAAGDPLQALPFDPRYDKVSQPFMPGAGWLEPQHTGVDYEVADRSPLYSVVGGTVSVQQGTWGPGGNEVTVTAPDGTKYLYGHVSAFTVKPGDTVTPGQQIAVSGGAGEPGSGFSTGAHLHLEVHNAQGQLVDPDPEVQRAFENAHGLTPANAASAATEQQAQTQATQSEISGKEAQIAAAEMGMHTPAEVNEFAQQLQAAGIDPMWYAQNFPGIAALRRKLLQKDTTIADVVPMNGMDPSAQQSYIRSQPHPTYPQHSAGDFDDMYSSAMLHSINGEGRTPHPAEINSLLTAKANWAQQQQFYTPRPLPPAPGAQPASTKPIAGTEGGTAATGPAKGTSLYGDLFPGMG